LNRQAPAIRTETFIDSAEPGQRIELCVAAYHRNKRGIGSISEPGCREVLRELVKWADVFVTNYPPRVRESLKMTYEDVSPLNDRLIYADITGYGDSARSRRAGL